MTSTTSKDKDTTMNNAAIQHTNSKENNTEDGNNGSRRKSLFDYEDFSLFLDEIYKEKMTLESCTYYNLWTKHYLEANSLSECQRNFEKALREAGRHGDVDKIEASVPKYWKNPQGKTDLEMFFRGVPTNFESFKDCEEVKSVDPLFNIWMENDSSAGQQKANGSSTQSNDNVGESPSSRMDVKFKGRDAFRREDAMKRSVTRPDSNSNNNNTSNNRVYVEPTDDDVLFGRGGGSNKHPGNARYRREVERLEKGYKSATKSEKRRIIEALVRTVQSRGSFLEKDKQRGWYVVDGDVVRKKVWQALREDRDPEKRRAKRKRFLAKRERIQSAKAQKRNTNIIIETR